MRDYTAHMYSSQGHTSVKIRQAKRQGKEYAPHPPWLVLPDQASEPTLTYARAPGHRGAAASRRWGLRGCAPADTGAKIPFNLPIRLGRPTDLAGVAFLPERRLLVAFTGRVRRS